jgi:DnaJ-class molecular chaperone
MHIRRKKYQEIAAARKLLELPETADLKSIKSNFRRLLTKWHPDKCSENQDLCNEMTHKIISAYNRIMDYCLHYQYSFSEETVKRHYSPEEWWFDRFGEDPLWGSGMQKFGSKP